MGVGLPVSDRSYPLGTRAYGTYVARAEVLSPVLEAARQQGYSLAAACSACNASLHAHGSDRSDPGGWPFRLRPFTLADFGAVREASGDSYIPLITTVPAAFTEDEGHRFIERQLSRAAQGTGYSFAIADAGTDRGVGQVGLWLKDLGEGRASIGYWVVRSARGRRAAASALQALALWALDDLQVPRLELYVEPWNMASIKTAERAGFQREGLLRSWQEVGGTRKDMYMYARPLGDP